MAGSVTEKAREDRSDVGFGASPGAVNAGRCTIGALVGIRRRRPMTEELGTTAKTGGLTCIATRHRWEAVPPQAAKPCHFVFNRGPFFAWKALTCRNLSCGIPKIVPKQVNCCVMPAHDTHTHKL